MPRGGASALLGAQHAACTTCGHAAGGIVHCLGVCHAAEAPAAAARRLHAPRPTTRGGAPMRPCAGKWMARARLTSWTLAHTSSVPWLPAHVPRGCPPRPPLPPHTPTNQPTTPDFAPFSVADQQAVRGGHVGGAAGVCSRAVAGARLEAVGKPATQACMSQGLPRLALPVGPPACEGSKGPRADSGTAHCHGAP